MRYEYVWVTANDHQAEAYTLNRYGSVGWCVVPGTYTEGQGKILMERELDAD